MSQEGPEQYHTATKFSNRFAHITRSETVIYLSQRYRKAKPANKVPTAPPSLRKGRENTGEEEFEGNSSPEESDGTNNLGDIASAVQGRGLEVTKS